MADNQSWTYIFTILLPQAFTNRLQEIRDKNRPFYEMSVLSEEESSNWRKRVLVGSVKNSEQFETNLIHKFYHIPASLLQNNNHSIDYVALYQSKHLFGKNCGILYYGKVKKCTLLPRKEIGEIPSVRENLYFRFDIEKWEKLPKKVKVKEQGSTAFFTNLYLLRRAKEVPQLWVHTVLDSYLYEYLSGNQNEKTTFRYKNGTLRVANHQIILHGNKKENLILPFSEFIQYPSSCFEKIRKYFLY